MIYHYSKLTIVIKIRKTDKNNFSPKSIFDFLSFNQFQTDFFLTFEKLPLIFF